MYLVLSRGQLSFYAQMILKHLFFYESLFLLLFAYADVQNIPNTKLDA